MGICGLENGKGVEMPSVVSQIIDEIVTRLEGVTGIGSVVAPKKDNDSVLVVHKTAIVRANDPQRHSEIDRAGNPPAVGWLLPIHVNCLVIPPEPETVHFDRLWSDFAEECQTAITSPAAWWKFGSICVNSELGTVTKLEPETDRPGGGRFVIAAMYRVSETNLNQIRG